MHSGFFFFIQFNDENRRTVEWRAIPNDSLVEHNTDASAQRQKYVSSSKNTIGFFYQINCKQRHK